MTMIRTFRTSSLAVAAVIGLMLGCSSEPEEKEPPMESPKIELPANPSETATTESPAAGQETSAPKPAGQPD